MEQKVEGKCYFSPTAQDAAVAPQVCHWQQRTFPPALLVGGGAPRHPALQTPSETAMEDDINLIK